MLYQKSTVENGKMKVTDAKVVDQSQLTSACWIIQIEGAKACTTCEFLNKPRQCGGMKIRELLGVPAPVYKSRAKRTSSVRFHFLTGDVSWKDFGGKWISQKLNNGEFGYWLVLEHTNLYDSCGEREAKEMGGQYMITLYMVSPDQAGEENLKKALECSGMSDQEISSLNDEMKVEALVSYGISAQLWYTTGNNAHKQLQEGREHARIEGRDHVGDSLGKFANRMGHTKADFLKGDLSFETAEKNRQAIFA